MNVKNEVCLIGVDFNSATPDSRVRFHLTRQRIEEIYRQNLIPEETIILSTCNRTEFYFWGADSFGKEFNHLKTVFGLAGLNQSSFYNLRGAEALLHLMELAVGLKSMIVGETEILGQINSACEIPINLGKKPLVLVEAFKKVLVNARKIRQKTNVGGNSSSLYTLVIREIKQCCPDLDNHSALILGNGVIAQKMGRVFWRQGIRTIILTRGNESKHAKRPQGIIKGLTTIFGYEQLNKFIDKSQIIVTATSAPHYILRPEHLSLLKQKVLVDLAFPRNIDPTIGREASCVLWDLEYFGKICAENRKIKEETIEEAKFLCLQEVERILELKSRTNFISANKKMHVYG